LVVVDQGEPRGQGGLFEDRENRLLATAGTLERRDDPQGGEGRRQALLMDPEVRGYSAQAFVQVGRDGGERSDVRQRLRHDHQVRRAAAESVGLDQLVDEVGVADVGSVAQQSFVHLKAERLDEVPVVGERGVIVVVGLTGRGHHPVSGVESRHSVRLTLRCGPAATGRSR
jgi:hypothetical protein